MKLEEIALNIVLCYTALLLNIIVHESGHAIAYKMNGICFIMNFGKGDVLFNISKSLVIRKEYLILPFPFAYVQYDPEDEMKAKNLPVKQEIFVTAAGILIQLLFLFVLLMLSILFTLPEFIQYYINGTIIIGLFSILIAILPSPFHETDGVYIFRVLKRIRKNRKKTDK